MDLTQDEVEEIGEGTLEHEYPEFEEDELMEGEKTPIPTEEEEFGGEEQRNRMLLIMRRLEEVISGKRHFSDFEKPFDEEKDEEKEKDEEEKDEDDGGDETQTNS